MHKWQVVMPYLGPQWNLEEYFESAGEITVPFLLVDNSKNSDSKRIAIPRGVEIEYHPKNLGVYASWNRGLVRGADWTVICSASIRFEEDGLSGFIERAGKVANPYGLFITSSAKMPTPPTGHHAGIIHYGLWIIGRATVDTIGFLDEHFWPYGWGDTDYGYRLTLSKIAGLMPWLNTRVTKVGQTLSAPFIRESGGATGAECRHYCKKWGGEPGGDAIWKHPFNDESLGLDYIGPGPE